MQNFYVEVFFPAAPHPYQQEHASPNETIGQLLEKALQAFNLAKDGFEYSLRHENAVLRDLAETIATVAGHHHHLKLTLARQIVSGGKHAFGA